MAWTVGKRGYSGAIFLGLPAARVQILPRPGGASRETFSQKPHQAAACSWSETFRNPMDYVEMHAGLKKLSEGPSWWPFRK